MGLLAPSAGKLLITIKQLIKIPNTFIFVRNQISLYNVVNLQIDDGNPMLSLSVSTKTIIFRCLLIYYTWSVCYPVTSNKKLIISIEIDDKMNVHIIRNIINECLMIICTFFKNSLLSKLVSHIFAAEVLKYYKPL